MSTELTTYSQRVAAITAILSRVIDLSRYAVNTRVSNPADLELTNGLTCSWGEPEFGLPRISVCINAVDDVADEVRQSRDHVAEYLLRGVSHYDPASASDLHSDRPDEYVFLFNYVQRLTVIVGHCEVTIMPHEHELIDLVDAALKIGRTVGCSPYEDDFVRPDYPEEWTRYTWVSPPFPPFRVVRGLLRVDP
jgi:hypothetical protein